MIDKIIIYYKLLIHNQNNFNNNNKVIREGEEEEEEEVEDKHSIKIEKIMMMMKDIKVELKIIYEFINLIIVIHLTRMYSAESDIK
jgi:hypothetical protein